MTESVKEEIKKLKEKVKKLALKKKKNKKDKKAKKPIKSKNLNQIYNILDKNDVLRIVAKTAFEIFIKLLLQLRTIPQK